MAALDAPRAVGSFFHHLLQFKKEGSLDGLPGYVEAGALHILSLKQVHRELCEATEGLRDATSEAKTQLDQSSLQLQNLLYEQQHYEKEIESCRAYKTAYPDEQLELILLEQFKEQHSELVSDDPHKVMLNRLSHELTSREETVRQLDAVKARRDALAADLAQKRSVLCALEGEIAKLRAAAQRVQQQFSITAPGLAEASRLAGMLPPPLYFLHAKLAAVAAALPAGGPVVASVGVVGGGEQAKAALHHVASTPNAAAVPPPAEQQTQGPYEAFPLGLTLALRKTPLTNSAPSLGLTFHYIPSLHIVTVEATRKEEERGGHARPWDYALLGALFPGDDGGELPGAAAAAAAADGGAVDVRQLPGKPYRWAQQAAGIDLLPPLPPQLYNNPGGAAAGQSTDLSAAAAALERYTAERRAGALFDKLKEAVLQQAT